MKVTFEQDTLGPEVLKLPMTVVDTVGIISLVEVRDVNKEYDPELEDMCLEYDEDVFDVDDDVFMLWELPGIIEDDVDGQYTWADTMIRTDVKLSKERHEVVNNIITWWLVKNEHNKVEMNQKITDAYLSLL